MDTARWDELSQKVAQITGRPLPPPHASGSPEFDDLMRALRVRDPQLWQEVVDFVTGDVSLPVEREAAAEQTRRKVADLVTAPFLRPDGLRTGRKRLNTTSLLMVGAAVAVAIVMAAQSRPPNTTRGTGSPTVGRMQLSSTTQPSPQPTSPSVAAGSAQTPALPPAATQPEPARSQAPAPPAGLPSLPLPPEAPEAARVPPPPQAAPATPAVRVDQSAVLFRSQAQQRDRASSPLLYSFHRSGEEGARQERASAVAFKAAPAPQGAGPLLYTAAQPRQTQAGSSGSQGLPPQAPQEPQPSARPALHVGQVFQAKLALPVSVSPAWGPVPVLAEISDGPLSGSLLWGQARMARDGSVEISFTQVIDQDRRTYPFNGAAYDPASGRTAVSGQVRTVTPNALQTLLSSSLQAASEYFKAKVESQSVTITNGFVTIRQNEPSFWDVYSRTIANAMTPRVPEGSGPVLVAHLPKGSVISVITMSEFSK